MPFEIFKQLFGDLEEYVIQQSETGNRCVVVPQLGAIVRQLSLRKNLTLFSVLKTPPTPEKLKEDSKSASELLFPFASRIPQGKYKFLGKPYQLEKNETGNQNAIHGLVRKRQFHLEEQAVHIDHASLTFSYLLDSPDGYPFTVKFLVKYSLHADGRFVVDYEALNQGNDPCPVMFGWHPYFVLGNEDADAWKINIPSDTVVTFDDNQIPTGVANLQIGKPALLNNREFDNCFVVKSDEPSATTELISDNQHITLKITQETGEGKFNHLVIYTPPARDCVAIEPLTANVDSFNSGDGLNILAPGNKIEGKITLKLD
ncbi:aldose 1-epimerase [Dyadobacter aurulentus]|uniref:aldose 1-epimerase n=1 Tax=Dyadobacter sp. UC 10 TaxID=2605428 RepID=UPI0011F36A95|nr:aldose 1-epimerase [Dyadobacter sp. UC 10]KAA0989417.1 aldose 1-epimerase [Dyadobacter sp. UC 10]